MILRLTAMGCALIKGKGGTIMLVIALNIAAAIAGLVAAWFWFQSACSNRRANFV